MYKNIVGVIFLFLQASCDGQHSKANIKNQYSCILEEVIKNKTEAYGMEFRKHLSDTLAYWINNIDNSFMRRYKKIRYEVSEYMLFNKNKSKGIGFVIKYRLAGELLDFIDVITGEKNDKGVWNFYYTGVPSMSFGQYGDSNPLKPISKDDMERRVLEALITDGYYKKNCTKDYRHFEKQWFPDWIKKKHQEEFYKPDQ